MRGSQKLIVTAHPPGMRARTRSGALGLADSCACDCHIALHAQAHPHPYAITERATNRVAPVANRTATLNLPNSSSLLDCPAGAARCVPRSCARLEQVCTNSSIHVVATLRKEPAPK